MDRTVRDHISFLEERIRELNKDLMSETRTRSERNIIEAEIRAAQTVLGYYRKALEIGQHISH